MITIEQVYEKLVQLTELCDREFKDIHHRLEKIETRLDRLERRQNLQDSKLDDFIAEIIEMKRDLKHPV
jgi:chaperonin cofactor prefoldin